VEALWARLWDDRLTLQASIAGKLKTDFLRPASVTLQGMAVTPTQARPTKAAMPRACQILALASERPLPGGSDRRMGPAEARVHGG
jgi:hypothetical protein